MRVWRASRVLQQDGWTALMKAAEAGNPDIVRLLLEHGSDVDHVDKVSAASGSYAKYSKSGV